MVPSTVAVASSLVMCSCNASSTGLGGVLFSGVRTSTNSISLPDAKFQCLPRGLLHISVILLLHCGCFQQPEHYSVVCAFAVFLK